MGFKLAVIGASLGGLKALAAIISELPADFKLPIAIVQHRTRESSDTLRSTFQRVSRLALEEPDDKAAILSGRIYLAPPNYHLLVEKGHFALSTDPPVEYSRPSVDVLFESAAHAYGPAVLGIVLTGANRDGARGASRIKESGGSVIVQDPRTAECPVMPQAALNLTPVDRVLPLGEIAAALLEAAQAN